MNLFKLFRTRKFMGRMYLWFTMVFFVLIVLFASITYLNTEKTVLENEYNNSKKIMAQMKYNISYMCDNIGDFCRTVYLNDDAVSILYEDNSIIDLYNKFDRLNSFLISNTFVNSICFYNNDTNTFYSNNLGLFENNALFDNIINCYGSVPLLKPVLLKNYNIKFGKASNDSLLFFMYEAADVSGRPEKALIVDINYKWLNENINMLNGNTGSQQDRFLIMDEPELDYVQLTWYLGQPTTNMSNEQSIMEEVNKVLKEKINANLKFVFTENSQYLQKLNIMMAANDEFDLANIGMKNFTSIVTKGSLLPLDNLLKEYGQTILEQVPEQYWQAVKYKGNIVGVIDLTAYATPHGLAFKKDLIEKYGFDYTKVQKLTDLEPYLETIKKNEKETIPYTASMDPFFGGAKWDAYDQITDGIVFDASDNKVKSLFDVQYIQETLKTLQDWYIKGYIAKDASLKKDIQTEVKSGKYAVFSDGGSSDETGVKATSVYGFPCVEKTISYPLIATGRIQNTVTGISKTSKNPERAMMLKNLMSEDIKLFNTMCYGLDGQDYKVVSGAGTDNPTVEAKTGNDMKWAIWHPWIGNLFLGWPSNWNSAKAIEGFKKNNETAKVSPILGFVFDPEPVKTEIAKLSGIIQTAYPILFTGSEPDYDQYITDLNSKLSSAGIQKVIDEVNSQLNAWKSTNNK